MILILSRMYILGIIIIHVLQDVLGGMQCHTVVAQFLVPIDICALHPIT